MRYSRDPRPRVCACGVWVGKKKREKKTDYSLTSLSPGVTVVISSSSPSISTNILRK